MFSLTGDGEISEGEIWEAALIASHWGLDNLTLIVDRNNCQIDGRTEDVLALNPVGDKFRSFNFHVIECNGNDIGELRKAFTEARATKGKPTCIVANTFMGRGVSFMEDDYRWHGKPPSADQAAEALKELA